MRLFTRKDLENLSHSSGGYHVSIFLPTHIAGTETEQDPIRFKNMIRRAEEELTSEGVRLPEIKSIMSPAYQLLNKSFFWEHQRKGLAVFISPNEMEYYRSNQLFHELVVVTHRFHLKPMLPLLSREEQFYILSISQDQVHLYQCNRDEIIQIDDNGIPKNMTEVIGSKNKEDHMHHHFIGSGGSGNQTSVLHGGGDISLIEKENLRKFFRIVDQQVNKKIADTRDPLIIATVDANFPIYKEVSTYPYLFENYISGNPDEVKNKDLLEKAFPLIRPFFKKERSEAEELYHKMNGTGKTSTQIEDIVISAKHGLIDTLFVAREIEQWGTVDEMIDKANLHESFETGDEDLLSYASIQTLIHKGTVFTVKPEFMPDKSNIAAILRY